MLKDTMRVRRRFAKVSFVAILLTLATVLGIVFFGSAEVAANLSAAQGIVMLILTCLTGLVGHYGHMVHSEDNKYGDTK